MDKLAWSAQMSLGVPAMDDAHKALIEELARLQFAPALEFSKGFSALVDELERDFRDEERLMEAIEFPALQSHREQHARVLGALHHLAPEVMRGDYESARKVIELLPQWFLFHLETMDAALAVALELAKTKEYLPVLQSSEPLSSG